MNVFFGKKLKKILLTLDEEERQKILSFAIHVKQYGLNKLEGKNKRSDGFSNDDPDFAKKMALVKKHNLWHYHIGIPCYKDSPSGEYKTSEYILHYKRGQDYIKIVDLDRHPPFTLPKPEYLT